MNGFALNNIQNAYVGSTPAQAIYIGSTLIWPTTPPTPHDYSQDYLTIVSLENNNDIAWMVTQTVYDDWSKVISVSTDNGVTWTSYQSTSNVTGTKLATLNTGDKLLIKGNNTYYGYNYGDQIMFGNHFISSGNFTVEGNIMSLIYDDNFIGQTTLSADNAFSTLFYNCTKLISAENLILPATVLSQRCYKDMFRGCTLLTTAPALSASILVDECYKRMFMDCTSLNYIKCLATDISANDCIYSFTYNVSNSGTFVKDANTTWPSGVSGIPSGWTVINA